MNSHAWSGQFKLIAWPFSDRLKQQALASAVLLDNLNLLQLPLIGPNLFLGISP
jgi:hypothetical protein